jgi:HK97 family phage portal protein
VSILARYTAPLVRNALPVPLVPTRRGGLASAFAGSSAKAGEDRTTPMERLGSVGTLFAVVDRCCTAVASQEWELYNRPADGKIDGGDEREPAGKHPALDLWRRPNAHMTTAELVYQLTQYRKLTGEWYLVIVRVPGTQVPLEVWPVRPDRMHPVPDAKNFLKGWIYKSPDGDDIPLPAADVIQSKVPNPLDPYRGLGVVQTILTELDASKYTAEWNRNFFLNSAEPGGIVQFEQNLSDQQWTEFVDRWRQQHQGVNNAHRVGVIENGTYVPRGYTQRDMEFTALREATRDQVIEAFGISRATLGITDGVNFAAAKAADTQFAKLVTVPELFALQQALNYRLLPQFYPGKLSSEIPVEFDYESPVGTDTAEEAADRTSRIGAVTSLWSLPGVKFDLDALMAAYDLPEVPWEEAAVPLPGQMFGPDGEILPSPDPSAPGEEGTGAGKQRGGASGDDGPPGKPGKSPQPGKSGKPPAKVPAPKSVAAPLEEDAAGSILAQGDAPEWDGAEHDAAWRAALDQLLAHWDSISSAQRAELGRQIATAIDEDELAALADLSCSSEDAAILLKEALVSVSKTAAGLAVAEVIAQGVSTVAAAQTAEEVADVATATAGLLAEGLAVAAGREALRRHDGQKTGHEVAAEVKATLAEQSDAPARAALGGALHGAMNRARVQTFAGAPVGSLYATEQLDSNTCAPCAAIDGRFICTTEDMGPLDRLYTAVGGYVDCLGGIRCRGTVTGVWRPEQREQGT